MKKEVIDKSEYSPRLSDLQKSLDNWLDTFEHDIENERVNLIVLGYDEKYKHCFQVGLTSESNPVTDVYNILNKSLGKLDKKISKDIFNGIGYYIANVIATYPDFENKFNDLVQKLKDKQN